MKTKHTFIIAFAIVLGFLIEPLSNMDFSDPSDRLIQVVETISLRGDDAAYYHSFEFCIRTGSTDWEEMPTGEWVSKGGFLPANEYALRAIKEMYDR